MFTEKNFNGFTKSLDGLRGVLAVWVMLSHISQLVDGPTGFVRKGGIAVDLFMLVSGFLMVWTIMARESKEPSNSIATWQKFLLRRLFRIAPLYILALLFAYVFDSYYSVLYREVYAAIGQGFDRPFKDCRSSIISDFLLHVTFIYGLFPCSSATNSLPDWSLSLEMQFYLVFPLLYMLLRKRSVFWVFLMLAVIAGVAQLSVGVYIPDTNKIISYPQPSILPLRINCFIVGMCCAAIVRKNENVIPLSAAMVVNLLLFQRLTFIAISGVVIMMFFAKGNLFVFRWDSKLSFPLRVLEGVLGLRIMRFLGDISFGVYLLHLLVLVPLIAALNSSAWFIIYSGSVKFLAVLVLSSPLVFILAYLAHRGIESPMIEFGRLLTSRSSNKAGRGDT